MFGAENGISLKSIQPYLFIYSILNGNTKTIELIMNKTLNLIIGIIAVANVIYSFWGNQESASIFGFSINIWLYRAIWVFIAAVSLNSYYRARKINH